jgi:hypothetical protein
MSIAIWESPVELFAGPTDGDPNLEWSKSLFSQTNNPIVYDVALSAQGSADAAAGAYVQATNWDGDLQAPVQALGVGALASTPFAPFAMVLTQSLAFYQGQELAVWWTPSATVAGAVDIEARTYDYSPLLVDSATPALTPAGATTTIASGVVSPQGWTFESNGTDIAFAYAVAVGVSTKTIELQILNTSGVAISARVQAAVGIASSTVYRVAYFKSASAFEFVEQATVGGVQGFDFSAVNTATGALGPATFQSVPLGDVNTGTDPIAIDSVGFSTLTNGDILEFVGYHDTTGSPNWRGVETRLLNASFQDISATTAGFVSVRYENIGQSSPEHWDVATLANGYTILIYTLDNIVTIAEFNASGDSIGDYGFSPGGQTPNDYDKIVAMGSRFEVTYRSSDDHQVYAVIYDTTTQGQAFTLNDQGNPAGQWAGSPFDDTVTYGAGINEINGGGGTDTFVANTLSSKQVSLSVNAEGQVVFSVDAADVDTLERFSTIQLDDGTVTISGDTLIDKGADGSKTVSIFNISDEPFAEKVTAYLPDGVVASVVKYNADGSLYSAQYTSQIPDDFTGSGRSDIVFQQGADVLATWHVDDTLIQGGASFYSFDFTAAYVGAGDLYGDGNSEALWLGANARLTISPRAGGSPGSVVVPLPSHTNVVGIGDFNGDHRSDLLLEDAHGEFWVDVLNSGMVGVAGFVSQVGAGWTFLGLGDFNGDGRSDLLFEGPSGQYATWLMNGDAIIGGATLGAPGAGWVYKGVGNFDGRGDSDILFENVDTGVYATWDVHNDAIAGGGTLGAPGAQWTLAAVGDYTANGRSDLLFRNLATGQYATWDVTGSTVSGGGALGDPGGDYIAPSIRTAAAPTLLFQSAAGQVATWTIADGAISGGGTLGNPGAGWTLLGAGDLYGDGKTDALFENTNGTYAVWRSDGQSLTGAATLGAAAGWTFRGLGDFNGDGTSDLLFENAAGAFQAWEMNGASVLNVAALGDPGLAFAGIGDFTGNGLSDVLLKDSAGAYWIDFVDSHGKTALGEVGNPGAGWTLAAIGDVSRDGRADLVFENASGLYASWDLNGNLIVGGGPLGTPGAQWTLAGIGDLNSAGFASLVFDNSATGQVATWLMDDTKIIGGAMVGTAAGFSLVGVR